MSLPAPFFVAPGTGTPARGRILLIGYDFPPGGSAGALRWQRLSHFAAERGWALDVITLDPSSQKAPEMRRLEELPAGTRVFGVPSGPLLIDRVEAVVYRALMRLKGLIPARSNGAGGGSGPGPRSGRAESMGRSEILELHWSPRVFVRTYYALLLLRRQRLWWRRAERVGRSILDGGGHRIVVTCGPPHPVHLAGSRLARSRHLPHVMDMRDPWSLVERLPEVVATPAWYRIASKMEAEAARGAALVVCNTRAARDAFCRVHPDVEGRCITVMNGYDDDVLPVASRGDRFVVAYAGSIYLDRDPRGLLRAAARVVRERGLAPADFGIEFMGNASRYDGLSLEDMAAQEGLEGFVRVRAPRPRSEAMEFLAGAAMLVSLPQDSEMAIPSKVFEYMRFDAWLLALAEEGSATHEVLKGSGADVVAPDDVDGIARVLRLRLDEYARQGPPTHPALVAECARARQAERLLAALDGLLPAGSDVVSPATGGGRERA